MAMSVIRITESLEFIVITGPLCSPNRWIIKLTHPSKFDFVQVFLLLQGFQKLPPHAMITRQHAVKVKPVVQSFSQVTQQRGVCLPSV